MMRRGLGETGLRARLAGNPTSCGRRANLLECKGSVKVRAVYK